MITIFYRYSNKHNIPKKTASQNSKSQINQRHVP